jgi:plastocyanin
MRAGLHPADATVLAVLIRNRLLALPVVVLLVVSAACGDDGGSSGADDDPTVSTQPSDCAVAEAHRVTIVAKDLAWSTDCIQAPEGVALTVVVDNQDDGVNHDLHITGLPGQPATPLEAGKVTQELDLGSDLTAGRYDFVCDIHPNMTGTLEVLAPLSEGSVTTSQ